MSECPSVAVRHLSSLKTWFVMWVLACLAASLPVQAEDYLSPENAFIFSATMIDSKTVEVAYKIADGYYMYRDRFQFRADGATLGQADFPHGKVKYDDNFQKEVETYRGEFSVRIPVDAAGAFRLTSTAQGCADKGLCYPPMASMASLSPDAVGNIVYAIQAEDAIGNAKYDPVSAAFKSRKLLTVLSLLFLLGVGLSMTPCVLPMVPILSSIIVGEGPRTSRRRGLILSAAYSLGMALVYTALGIAAGLIGEGLSATLQKPWVLSLFAVLMIALALSMFDLYQLQLPSGVQSGLMRVSGKQGGKLWGVFAMGAMSALIVGPCVAPPLAGTLLYISQTRDVVLGGSALFAMALGMSMPLLIIGTSAGALVPRAGSWMQAVNRFFGVAMLATALWMVSPVIPAWLFVAGWAALGIGYGAYLLWKTRAHWAARAFGLAFAALGVLQLINVATGGHDALAPLSRFTATAQTVPANFVRIRSVDELDAALAQTGGKPALLDFYADWCVSCKEMERFTFPDERVREKFSHMVLMQIDVTANNADDRAMLKRFQLFGPPGIILFDAEGRELTGKRIIGYQNADQFLSSLQSIQP